MHSNHRFVSDASSALRAFVCAPERGRYAPAPAMRSSMLSVQVGRALVRCVR
jgi:hypothetical protein